MNCSQSCSKSVAAGVEAQSCDLSITNPCNSNLHHWGELESSSCLEASQSCPWPENQVIGIGV